MKKAFIIGMVLIILAACQIDQRGAEQQTPDTGSTIHWVSLGEAIQNYKGKLAEQEDVDVRDIVVFSTESLPDEIGIYNGQPMVYHLARVTYKFPSGIKIIVYFLCFIEDPYGWREA